MMGRSFSPIEEAFAFTDTSYLRGRSRIEHEIFENCAGVNGPEGWTYDVFSAQYISYYLCLRRIYLRALPIAIKGRPPWRLVSESGLGKPNMARIE